jgi:alpha-tubulin suppressor-like RCC1 family protein
MASRSIPRLATRLVCAALLAACADRHPSAPQPEVPTGAPRTVRAQLRCEVRVDAGTMRCRPAGGAARAVILGNGTGAVSIAGQVVSDDSVSLTLSVYVENYLTRALGTTDGTTLHPDGVRVFFAQGPTVVAGSGVVTVANADGTAAFTAANQEYFQYDQIVQPGGASSSKTWQFTHTATVEIFDFILMVSTEVPYPDGWVEVVPGAWMRVGATQAFAATVRDSSGGVITGQSVTWSISDTTVATVSAAGVVRAVSPGIATLSAATATRPSGITAQVVVTAAAPFVSISGGFYHTCAVDTSGQAHCWGYNLNGRLGVGPTTAPYLIPTAVQHPSGVTFSQVSAGGSNSCARTSAGQAYCWGYNVDGRLGDGTTTQRNTPVAVQHPQGVTFTQLSVGGGHTCALAAGGQAWCWGQNADGQLGDSSTTTRSVPTAVKQPAGVAFATIRAGGFHSCAATEVGQVYCWGRNTQGQLGDGTTTDRAAPVAVLQPTGVSLPAVAAGYLHSCGVTQAGQAWCWGRNANGQLGDNSTTNRTAPVAVQQGSVAFRTATAGQDHTCAYVTSTGAAYCWGGNARGQLGDGSTTGRLTPVAVQQPAGAPFDGLAAGLLFTCGVSAGQGWCWGANASGQVGDSTTVDRVAPVPTWN